MDTCEKESDRPAYVATRHRDGLIIALLMACPMRIKNLADLVIGQHLVFEGQAYVVKVSAAGTKAGRPHHAAIPLELTPYIDGWLQVHREDLQSVAKEKGLGGSVGGHLWINRYGRPMRSEAIRQQIETRMKQAFGNAIWPHLFRDCAVTKLVDTAPKEIGIAPARPRRSPDLAALLHPGDRHESPCPRSGGDRGPAARGSAGWIGRLMRKLPA